MRKSHASAKQRRRRRGIVVILFAVMVPVFVGLTALAVDVAIVALARDQLNTAADAAALAAAMELANEYRVRGVTNLDPEIQAANTQAVALAQANSVLNQQPVLTEDPDNDGTGDILVGYMDPNNPTAAMVTTGPTTQYNSVQVTANRNATHGGPVPTFFGQIFGYQGTDVTVQSTATAQNYSIAAFQPSNNLNAHMLPIVLDLYTYDAMIAGETQDNYTYNPSSGTVTAGPDGITESTLYPVGSGSPGNWGTIQVGVTNNSTSTLNSQILSGITPAQLATFPNSTIGLNPTLSPPSITFTGNPGISAGISSSLTAIIGDPVTIPIYDINGGNGSNSWYRVVQFAGVRIMAVNFKGNPKYVVVQPALITDATAVAGLPLSSWTQGGLIVVHLTR